MPDAVQKEMEEVEAASQMAKQKKQKTSAIEAATCSVAATADGSF